MGEISKIQWTDATWNPWHGCKKVSEGCKFCYMYRDKERYGQDPTTVIRSKSTFIDPIRWSFAMQNIRPGKAANFGSFPGMKIFTCSWSDFFIEEADEWRGEAWEIIKNTPEFTYQILTKRPERILQCLPDDWGEGYPNVWLGVSAENQERLNDRYIIFKEIPARVRFLSIEPLLAPIYIDANGIKEFIHWVIIGGESGNDTGKYKYRPCELDWMQWIVEDCRTSGIPVFVKQLGTHLAKELRLKDRHGGDISEFPHYLRIREMPKPIK